MQEIVQKTFEVGAKVVYPSHGLGTIQRIEDRTVCGMAEPCYVIRFPESGMTIKAPVKAAKAVGLRKIIPRNDIVKVIRILKKNEKIDDIEPNWNKRQKIYLEKIKSGSLFEVASVYRDLFLLRNTKGLSFGEQQVFDNAHKLMVSEIAESKGIGVDKVAQMLSEALTN